MDAYQPPLDQFLRFPEEPGFGLAWPDYLALGFDSGHVPELIRMATDRSLNEADEESPEVWAPVHAWRTLGQLRAEAAIGPLLAILAAQTLETSDDWASEELPVVIGMIGPAAIPEARSILEDPSASDEARIDACRSLGEIGQIHPTARDECVAILSMCLEQGQDTPPDVNAFLVNELIKLGADEAAGVIERAFAAGIVDESVNGSWYDVWHALDLDGEPPLRPERRVVIDEDEDEWDDEERDWVNPFRRLDGPAHPHEPRPGWQPADSRTPEERKDRNKALQKLVKKVKGKKGKKR
ncbi:PBS lyase [Tundrisphaera lichenicola]|uniref:PBS lyase n=1 Tax=Tundrisphaera lichenicola TaxID=2029860 RepID=UPI003EB93C5B